MDITTGRAPPLHEQTNQCARSFGLISNPDLIRLYVFPTGGHQVVAGKQIEFKGVEVVTPTGHSLVKDLTFTITPGTNMLIVGPNGAGKSSIFRCLGSLWTVKQVGA